MIKEYMKYKLKKEAGTSLPIYRQYLIYKLGAGAGEFVEEALKVDPELFKKGKEIFGGLKSAGKVHDPEGLLEGFYSKNPEELKDARGVNYINRRMIDHEYSINDPKSEYDTLYAKTGGDGNIAIHRANSKTKSFSNDFLDESPFRVDDLKSSGKKEPVVDTVNQSTPKQKTPGDSIVDNGNKETIGNGVKEPKKEQPTLKQETTPGSNNKEEGGHLGRNLLIGGGVVGTGALGLHALGGRKRRNNYQQ